MQVLEQHGSLPAVEHDFTVATSDLLSPPLIVDSPILKNCFDRLTAAFVL